MRLEQIPDPEQMGGERYFEIRDIDSSGCGSFRTYCVSAGTPESEIYDIACQIHTEDMNAREDRYYPGFFSQPPYWRPTLRVVEMKRQIVPLDTPDRNGRTFRNEWQAKRGGLKFTIVNRWIKIKMTNGAEYKGNGYEFGKQLTRLN